MTSNNSIVAFLDHINETRTGTSTAQCLLNAPGGEIITRTNHSESVPVASIMRLMNPTKFSHLDAVQIRQTPEYLDVIKQVVTALVCPNKDADYTDLEAAIIKHFDQRVFCDYDTIEELYSENIDELFETVTPNLAREIPLEQGISPLSSKIILQVYSLKQRTLNLCTNFTIVYTVVNVNVDTLVFHFELLPILTEADKTYLGLLK